MAYRLIFILGVFAVVVLSSLLYFFYSLIKSHRKWKEEVRSNPKDRMSKSKQDFIDFYLKLGYEEESIDFVYSHAQKFLKAKDLILLHTDDIVNLYQREEDEWFFILNRWLKGLNYAEVLESHFKEKYSNSLGFEFLIRTIQSKGMI
jgi:hypothetical protein